MLKQACILQAMQASDVHYYAIHSAKLLRLAVMSCTQVHMLEEVVRQLSHDLSMAEKAIGSGQAQADANAAQMALPAAEREVKALSTRVGSCTCCVWFSWLRSLPGLSPLLATCLSRPASPWSCHNASLLASRQARELNAFWATRVGSTCFVWAVTAYPSASACHSTKKHETPCDAFLCTTVID